MLIGCFSLSYPTGKITVGIPFDALGVSRSSLSHTLFGLYIGLMAMAKSYDDTNDSQFFITTVVTSWLDGKHVVFGEVADDKSMHIVQQIEKLGTQSGTPKGAIKIESSGEGHK